MPQSSQQITLYLGIIASLGLIYLFFATLSPFFSALAWAGVLAYGLYPLQRHVLRWTRGRANLSAFLLCILLTVGFILPVLSLSVLIGAEIAKTYRLVGALISQSNAFGQNGWHDYPFVSTLLALLDKYERLTGADLQSVFADNLAKAGQYLVQQLSYMAGNVLLGLFQLGIILISTFYLFRDGEALVRWVRSALPINENRQEFMIQRFQDVVTGTVYGNSVIALMEGLLGGIAFWIVGLPSPILWGTLMGILAFLPLVGAGIVWIPGAIYLFFQDDYSGVLILIIIGTLIAVLDYVVRTILIGSRSKLHTLLVFLSVLGGIQLFGLVGVVAGPLVMAIFTALIETYREHYLSPPPHLSSPTM